MKALFFCFWASAAIALAQPTLIEKVEDTESNGLVIPYEKYSLPNGLVVLLHQDNSDPMVHVDVTYHVGSAREVPGRSGFAHFFEHMMFQGSDHVADEEHFKIVTESGGTLNGTTNTDRTNYFETMPANQLETALWLEADRMGFFLDAVTQEKFEVQRATVKNERGQRYDNRPYGLVYEKTIEALYPFGHPYSWSTIGYIEDLNAATLDDLKQFFLRWYGPNNATLTIAGDFETAQALELVEKYFGPIPKGPEVEDMPPMPTTLNEDKYVSYEDKVRFPMLYISYPTVEARHPDEPALDVVADVLGGGESSMMYRTFVKGGLARTAYASHPCSELAGAMGFGIMAYPDKPLAEMHRILDSLFDAVEKRGFKQEDIDRFAAQYESRQLSTLATIRGKASALAAYETFTGNPNQIGEDLKKYKKLKPEDLMRVFKKYIKGAFAVHLSCVPKGGSELIAAPDNAGRPEVPQGFSPDLSMYANLKYRKAKDTFDRSVRPKPGPNPVVQLPSIWEADLPDGGKAIGAPYDEVPLVSVRLSWPGGRMAEGMNEAGLAKLTASMLNESTKKSSKEALRDRMDLLGAEVSAYASEDEMGFNVRAPFANIDKALAILEEMILEPGFKEEEFKRVKMEQLEDIANEENNAGALANKTLFRYMFPDHVLGISGNGTKEIISRMEVADVMGFCDRIFSPALVRVAVVGIDHPDNIIPSLSFLSKMPSRMSQVNLGAADSRFPEKTKLILVDKPGAAQSEIRYAFDGPPYSATGLHYQLNVANYVLGGAFNSRLNLNLREDKGYTYGVRSGFRGNRFYGYYLVSGAFLKESTDKTIVEIVKELKKYREEGPGDEEVAFTRSSIGQRDALNYEAPWQRAGMIAQILEYNLPLEYTKIQQDMLADMTKQTYADLMKQELRYDRGFIVVVGDAESIREPLEKLGYPMEVIDAQGNPIP